MGKIFCKFCGKEITGEQNSCYPGSGYMCYDCKHTRYPAWLLEKLSNTEMIMKEQKVYAPRDRITLFLSHIGWKTEEVDGETYYLDPSSPGKIWFVMKDSKWYLMFKRDGVEMKFDCDHVSSYHYPEEETLKDNKLGFWFDPEEMKRFLNSNKESDKLFGADIIIAAKTDTPVMF